MADPDDAAWAEYQEFLQWRRLRGRAPAPPAEPELTISALWSAWYPTVQHTGRGPNIRTHRAYVLETEFQHEGRALKLGDITPSQCTVAVIEAWRAQLRVTKNRRSDILAADYRDQIRLSLQAMFTYHVTTGTLARNPLKGLEREKGWKGRKRLGYPTREFLDRFQAYCRPVVADMMWLSFEAGGMRRDEVRLLLKAEYDKATQTICLQADRNKNDEPRVIVLTALAASIVERWSANSRGLYVFGHPDHHDGREIPASTLWGWVDDARALARADGLDVKLAGDQFTFHHARHGYTMRMQGKAPESWIADQLGHSSTEMIRERYGRLRGAEAREQFRQMAEMRTPPPERKGPHHTKPDAPLHTRVGKPPSSSRP